MALRLQSSEGSISEAGIRLVRQAVSTGEHVHRADVLAIINAHLAMVRELREARDDLARVQGVLNTLERDALHDKASAWTEGWTAGSDAMIRDLSGEARILALLDAAGLEANPYSAQLDEPVVEDPPGEVTC